MKKLMFVVVLFILGTATLKAQISTANSNQINFSDQTINGQFLLTKDKSVLIQNFGQPQTISKDYWETTNDTATVYHYNGVVFYIVKNLVYSFTITGSQYNFSPYNIKVGENMDRLQAIFPLSYEHRQGSKGKSLYLLIKGNDSFVEIYADSSGIIKSIDMRDF